MITRKLINGIWKRIERITYPSTGAIVDRILPMDSNIAEEVIVVKEPTNLNIHSHIQCEPIHNQEYLQYFDHFGRQMGI
jgi:hypothetical protein